MRRPVVTLLLLGWLAMPAHAATVPLFATLDGAQEVPPTASLATGQGAFLYDDTSNLLAFSIGFSNLSSAELFSHIHGPAAPGVNAGILFDLPAGPIKFGTWTVPDALEPTLLGGLTYVNVHSTQFPNGEIRGQIAPITPVPEPGIFAMLAAGIVAAIAIVRRRKPRP